MDRKPTLGSAGTSLPRVQPHHRLRDLRKDLRAGDQPISLRRFCDAVCTMGFVTTKRPNLTSPSRVRGRQRSSGGRVNQPVLQEKIQRKVKHHVEQGLDVRPTKRPEL
ncbi:hypothetical protein PoB_001356200 [Plakobranchus ocellatus]|uniref:Uncharacterized protein n=1 Tax=Plakobranchus ocellatus TaxID=259542 RepID=A0AAV3YXI6_9GAST|nr:hypothetical protein PoB_001356200 [Plakobranchus ocellatus]